MKINLARLLIGAVFIMNVQCAVLFLAQPASFAPGFELSGGVGEAALRGMGVLFLMWNVPYAVALWNPIRQYMALLEAIAMQAIGLVGELFVRSQLPAVNALARLSLGRFILLDALGLIALLAAAWLVGAAWRKAETSRSGITLQLNKNE
jgi:hypothetical protein